jgi:hypothetical protein
LASVVALGCETSAQSQSPHKSSSRASSIDLIINLIPFVSTFLTARYSHRTEIRISKHEKLLRVANDVEDNSFGIHGA